MNYYEILGVPLEKYPFKIEVNEDGIYYIFYPDGNVLGDQGIFKMTPYVIGETVYLNALPGDSWVKRPDSGNYVVIDIYGTIKDGVFQGKVSGMDGEFSFKKINN